MQAYGTDISDSPYLIYKQNKMYLAELKMCLFQNPGALGKMFKPL